VRCQGAAGMLAFAAFGAGTAMITKECPWCGENMRLKEREATDRIPGTSEVKKTKAAEWVCPSCDHFEEAEPEDTRR